MACEFCGVVFLVMVVFWLRADEVRMQNGDRYIGKVLSVSGDTLVLESQVLGRIQVPRKDVAHVTFGTNRVATASAPTAEGLTLTTNPPGGSATMALARTNVDLSAALRGLGANTNFIQQVREKMLLGNPEASAKYDELVNGLLSGKLDLNGLRREAKSSADQLRSLQQELGPDVGDSLDAYLEVLDNFLKETGNEPTNATSAPQRP